MPLTNTSDTPPRRHDLDRVGPVMVRREDLAAIRRLADDHGRTLAGEIRYAIRVYVQSCLRREQRNGGDPS